MSKMSISRAVDLVDAAVSEAATTEREEAVSVLRQHTRTEKRTDAQRIISMLERRERTARMAYEEARDARDECPEGSGARTPLVIALNRASARYQEAQEAVSMARMIAG